VDTVVLTCATVSSSAALGNGFLSTLPFGIWFAPWMILPFHLAQGFHLRRVTQLTIENNVVFNC
jgi:hypothetical protein